LAAIFGRSSAATLRATEIQLEPERSRFVVGNVRVDIGRREKIAAGSTMAAVFVAMALVAETGARLAAAGHEFSTFVSPNVPGVAQDHNLRVFDEYARRWFERAPGPVARE